MKKKFLKRFERLENTPKDLLIKKGLKISKRFDHLEIGDKKIEVLITDKITQEEKAPVDIRHTIICPYCGMDNDSEVLNCSFCQHNLKTKLADTFQDQHSSLMECECGAKNQKGRPFCWVCGKYLGDKEPVETSADNVITLNLDGREYRSNEENLPLDVKILIERIRKNGYSKAVIDAWLKERAELVKLDTKAKTKNVLYDFEKRNRLREIRMGLIARGMGLIVFVVFLIFQFSTCSRYYSRFR